MPGVLNKNKIPIHAAGIIETDVHRIRSIGNTLCTALLLSRFFKWFPVAVYRIPEERTGPVVRKCMVRAFSVSKSIAGTACEIFLINLIEFATTNSGQNISHFMGFFYGALVLGFLFFLFCSTTWKSWDWLRRRHNRTVTCFSDAILWLSPVTRLYRNPSVSRLL